MIARLRSGVLPLYLLLCVVLGGSTQGIYSNLALQLAGIALILWAFAARRPGALPREARVLAWLPAAVALLFAVQLIPLPPGLWTSLPGQDGIAEGYRMLGMALPWRPMSVTPHETLATTVTLIPPLAVLCWCLLTDDIRPTWIAAAVLAATFLSVVLGALQVGSSGGPGSPWYFYRFSSFGQATGFFANSNHMGSLLMISIPFVAAMVRLLRDRRSAKVKAGAVLLGSAALIVIGVGIVLNGSLAVLLLGVPVTLLSGVILAGERRRRLRGPLMAAAAAAAVVAVVLAMSALPARLFSANIMSVDSRREIWATTLKPLSDFFPLGSGIGSFRQLYPRYEAPGEVTATVVNNAHNDYLEIVLETGLAGIALLLVFLLWWMRRVRGLWGPQGRDRFAMAAAVASGALLMHSIVDYPLRMPALSAIMAACLALLASSYRGQSKVADLWSTRHVQI